jgi:hypothetical protein
MPVVGSTITIDLHITEDADLDSVQAVVRRNERVHPDFAQDIRQAVENIAAEALEESGIDSYNLSVDLELVTGRVPGAPRERIVAALDVEGEDSVVAGVDDAVSAPERAEIADAVEAVALSYLRDNDLSNGADVIVSVTPIAFQ